MFINFFLASKRPVKETLLISSLPSNCFVHKASSLRNTFPQMVGLYDFNMNQNPYKSQLKNRTLLSQQKGDISNWELLLNLANSTV